VALENEDVCVRGNLRRERGDGGAKRKERIIDRKKKGKGKHWPGV